MHANGKEALEALAQRFPQLYVALRKEPRISIAGRRPMGSNPMGRRSTTSSPPPRTSCARWIPQQVPSRSCS